MRIRLTLELGDDDIQIVNKIRAELKRMLVSEADVYLEDVIIYALHHCHVVDEFSTN